MYRFVLVACCSAFSFIFSQAQEVSPPLPKMPWHIRSYNNAIGSYYSPPSFRRSICYLPEGGAVAAIQYDNLDGGAMRVKEDGKIMWQTRVDGWVKGIGRADNNFIVAYHDENVYEKQNASFEFQNPSKKMYVALLDGNNGKVLKKVLIHENDEPVYTDYRALTRPDGSIQGVLIGVTAFKKVRTDPKKAIRDMATRKILWVSIDGALNANPVEINSGGPDKIFIGAELGANDNLFISFFADDQLTVERFDRTGKQLDKLSAPLEIKQSWNTVVVAQPTTLIHPENPDAMIIGVRYPNKSKDISHQVFQFDMKAKKVTGTGERELNKEYEKNIETASIKEMSNGKKWVISSLRIMNIIVTKQRIAVVKTKIYTENINDINRYRNDEVIIDIFDHNWKLLKTVGLDRFMQTLAPSARSVGAKAYGEKLRVIMPALKGSRMNTLYAEVDLVNQKVELFTTLSREGVASSASNLSIVEGDASIWLADGVWIENLISNDKLLWKKRENYSSTWQKVKF